MQSPNLQSELNKSSVQGPKFRKTEFRKLRKIRKSKFWDSRYDIQLAPYTVFDEEFDVHAENNKFGEPEGKNHEKLDQRNLLLLSVRFL